MGVLHFCLRMRRKANKVADKSLRLDAVRNLNLILVRCWPHLRLTYLFWYFIHISWQTITEIHPLSNIIDVNYPKLRIKCRFVRENKKTQLLISKQFPWRAIESLLRASTSEHVSAFNLWLHSRFHVGMERNREIRKIEREGKREREWERVREGEQNDKRVNVYEGWWRENKQTSNKKGNRHYIVVKV